MSDNDTLFDELRDAILEADNPKDRAMLLIMQRFLARVEEMLEDDSRIKTQVLNGHANRHHSHHDLIEEMIPVWEEQKMICAWAKTQMRAQQTAMEENHSLWRRFLEGAASQAGTIIMSLAAAALGVAYLLK